MFVNQLLKPLSLQEMLRSELKIPCGKAKSEFEPAWAQNPGLAGESRLSISYLFRTRLSTVIPIFYRFWVPKVYISFKYGTKTFSTHMLYCNRKRLDVLQPFREK